MPLYQTKIYANLPILTQVEIFPETESSSVVSTKSSKSYFSLENYLIRACLLCNCPRKVGLGIGKLEECQVISASYLGF